MSNSKVLLEESELRKIIRESLLRNQQLSEGANDDLSTVVGSYEQECVPIAKMIGYFIYGSNHSPSYGIENFWIPLKNRVSLDILARTLTADGGKRPFISETDAEFGGGQGIDVNDVGAVVLPALKFVLLNLIMGRPVSYRIKTGSTVNIKPGSRLGAIVITDPKTIWYSGTPTAWLTLAGKLGYTNQLNIKDEANVKSLITTIINSPELINQMTTQASSDPAVPGGLSYDAASKAINYSTEAFDKEMADKVRELDDALKADAIQSLDRFNTVPIREAIFRPLAFPGNWIAYTGAEDQDSMFTSPWRQTWGMFNMLSKTVTQSDVSSTTALAALAINFNNYLAEGAAEFSGASYDTSEALNEARRKVILTHEQLTRVIQAALVIKLEGKKHDTLLERSWAEFGSDVLAGARRAFGLGDEAAEETGAIARVVKGIETQAQTAGDLAAAAARRAEELRTASNLKSLGLSDAVSQVLTELFDIMDRGGRDVSRRFESDIVSTASNAALNKQLAISVDEISSIIGPNMTPTQRALVQDYLDAALEYVNQITNPNRRDPANLEPVNQARAKLQAELPAVLISMKAKVADIVLAKQAKLTPSAASAADISEQLRLSLIEAFDLSAASKLQVGRDASGFFTYRFGPTTLTLDDLAEVIADAKSSDAAVSGPARQTLKSYGFRPLAGKTGSETETAELFTSVAGKMGPKFQKELLNDVDRDFTGTRVQMVFDTLTGDVTARALNAAAQTPISGNSARKALNWITKTLTVDGRADTILANYRKYKEAKALLPPGASTKALTAKFIGTELLLAPLSGQRIQTTVGRAVFELGAVATSSRFPGLNSVFKSLAGEESYWTPRFTGWLITAAIGNALYNPEKSPENEFGNALYKIIMTGSTLRPAGLGTVILRALAGGISFVIPSDSDVVGSDPYQQFRAAVANPQAALDFLNKAVLAYSEMLTGSLNQQQLTTIFPGLTSRISLSIDDFPEAVAIIQRSTTGPVGIIKAMVDYYREAQIEEVTAEAEGKEPDKSEAQAKLQEDLEKITEEQRQAAIERAALEQMIATKTAQFGQDTEAGKKLKSLTGTAITLCKYFSSDIQSLKRQIGAPAQSSELQTSSLLASTKDAMLKNYGRKYGEEKTATAAANVIPTQASAFIEKYGGEGNLITLAVHAAMQAYTGFSDDPASLTSLGMGFVKVHSSEFGFDLSNDEFTPAMLQKIGDTMNTSCNNFTKAYQSALQFAGDARTSAETAAAQSKPAP
jgi:hypothetical protein